MTVLESQLKVSSQSHFWGLSFKNNFAKQLANINDDVIFLCA